MMALAAAGDKDLPGVSAPRPQAARPRFPGL